MHVAYETWSSLPAAIPRLLDWQTVQQVHERWRSLLMVISDSPAQLTVCPLHVNWVICQRHTWLPNLANSAGKDAAQPTRRSKTAVRYVLSSLSPASSAATASRPCRWSGAMRLGLSLAHTHLQQACLDRSVARFLLLSNTLLLIACQHD